MEKKQTAVQWIIEQLQAPCRGIPSHIIEQALQMEREQIEEAFKDGITGDSKCVTATEYYTQTFKP